MLSGTLQRSRSSDIAAFWEQLARGSNKTPTNTAYFGEQLGQPLEKLNKCLATFGRFLTVSGPFWVLQRA